MPTRGWWLLVGSLIGVAATAGAVIPEVEQQTTPSGYAARLADPVHREAALEELVRRKNRGVLTEVARGDGDVAARGWAVVGLARVGGEGVDDTLDAAFNAPTTCISEVPGFAKHTSTPHSAAMAQMAVAPVTLALSMVFIRARMGVIVALETSVSM